MTLCLPLSRPATRLRIAAIGTLLALSLAALPAAAVDLSLRVPGVEKDLANALKDASLVASARRDGVTAPQELLAAADADYARLLAVLYDAGYYSAVISIRADGREVASISPFDAPRNLRDIVISVETGPRFAFGRARIAPLARRTELPEGFAPGKPASTGIMEEAVGAAVDAWRDTGRPKARPVDQRITADHRSARVDAEFALDPGRHARFGRLIVQGNNGVRAARIIDIAGLPAGAPFSPAELEEAARRLRRSGAFSSVALSEGETINPDGTIDITAQVSEAKPRRFGVGAEFGTEEGLSLSGFWLHRNLRTGAERLRFEATVDGIGGNTGGTDYDIAAIFSRPATFTPDTTAELKFEIEHLEEPDFTSTNFDIEGGVRHIFSDQLEGRIALGYRHAEVDDDFGSRAFELIKLPTQLTWDGRDDPLDATTGLFGDAEFRPFYNISDSSIATRLTLDGRAYRKLGERLVLAGRVQFGSVTGVPLLAVPPDFLFFSGGGGTVRGQDFQDLAIDQGGGRRSGGRSFAALSLEARVAVTGPWGAVLFADAGYVGENSLPDGTGDWHAGAGFGIRYATPIGPIRVDLGTPVRGGTSGSVELYIGIGQAF